MPGEKKQVKVTRGINALLRFKIARHDATRADYHKTFGILVPNLQCFCARAIVLFGEVNLVKEVWIFRFEVQMSYPLTGQRTVPLETSKALAS